MKTVRVTFLTTPEFKSYLEEEAKKTTGEVCLNTSVSGAQGLG